MSTPHDPAARSRRYRHLLSVAWRGVESTQIPIRAAWPSISRLGPGSRGGLIGRLSLAVQHNLSVSAVEITTPDQAVAWRGVASQYFPYSSSKTRRGDAAARHSDMEAKTAEELAPAPPRPCSVRVRAAGSVRGVAWPGGVCRSLNPQPALFKLQTTTTTRARNHRSFMTFRNHASYPKRTEPAVLLAREAFRGRPNIWIGHDG